MTTMTKQGPVNRSHLGVLPSGWKLRPLKSFTSKIGSGATPRGGNSVYLPQRVSHALIRSQNVYDRHFDDENLAFISEDHAVQLRNTSVQKGDVLLNITGDGVTFGRACIVPSRILPACVNQHVSILRVDPCQADPGFLLSFLTHPQTKVYMESFNTGGSRRAITKGHIESFEVPLPPLATQRKIAGFLSVYDDLIENNLRRITILEKMAQSLYREWFVHFRFPGYESGQFIDSDLGKIPKGWSATTLGEFVENKSVHLQTGPFGTQLKASHYSHEGTPVINVRNIGFGTLRADKLEFLPPDKVDELKRHQLRSGDIVFGRKGAVERHLLVGPVEDGWIQGSDCIRLRVVSGPLTPRFLSIGFREAGHQRWMMNQCSGGATMASLNQDILCRIPLAVPPPELIAKFDKFSTSAVDEVDVLASKIQTLRRTRDLLLPKLLSPSNV